VDVGNDTTLRNRDALCAADHLVFTNGCDIVGQDFLHRAAIGMCSRENGVGVVSAKAQRNAGDLADEILELFVLGNEVGLTVDFNGRTLGAVNGNANKTFGRSAARLLGSSGKTLGAQQVNCGFHVAIGFFERLLGVHHAGA